MIKTEQQRTIERLQKRAELWAPYYEKYVAALARCNGDTWKERPIHKKYHEILRGIERKLGFTDSTH